MRRLVLLALSALVTLMLGCGSAATTPSAVTPPATTSSSAVSVSNDLLQAIASGEEAGVGMKPVRGFAVKSRDFSNVYMVAMEFSATGVNNQVGVWATNSLTSGGGLIMAVDGYAKQFTVWPDSDTTDAAITISADGVEAAKSALRSQ